MKTIFEGASGKRGAVILWMLLAAAAVVLTACRRDNSATKPADVDYYTCTMHPSVRSLDPKGKCPICSMDLVPVMKKGAPAAGHEHPGHAEARPAMEMPVTSANPNASEEPSEFTIPPRRLQQIGVTYGMVEKRSFTNHVRVVGTVAYDKQRHWDYVARVEGYVEKLFVFSPGEMVEKNAPLLTLYSPELLTTQKEFVDLLRNRDETQTNRNTATRESTERLLESAKLRLKLWNIGGQQIAELEKTRKPQEFLTLYSPFKGVVQTIGVDQGRRVMLGDHLVDIADLSAVWIWAEFYQDELPMLKPGLPVSISSSSQPGMDLKGKIALINPFINDASRTARVRIDVENPEMKLQPDMYVDVTLNMEMGESLAIPASAVLPTGKHNVVFVDKGEGKLEPRFVELGRKFGDAYELRSGVKAGERVVTSANFLIDAEAKVQGALGSW